MIPLKLTLKNFLSYRQATLDFRGLHTACICGANGAGKSSLLEAITWAIWGKCRAVSDEDLVHKGEKMVRVDFDFIINEQVYRIIRNRSKSKNIDLQFQIQTEENNFISLTGKAIKDTQKEIISALKLDYDTFVNSAYLRQGRADEFMLRKPQERKQILIDLLKLDHYEELAEQAKDLAKQFKVESDYLASTLAPIEEQLERRFIIEQEKASVKTQIKMLQELQKKEQEQLVILQGLEQNRQSWENQVKLQENQLKNIQLNQQELREEIDQNQTRLDTLAQLLVQRELIELEYSNFLKLQEEEEKLADQWQEYQKLQNLKNQWQRELEKKAHELNLNLSQKQANLDNLLKQEQEQILLISKKEEINVNFAKLKDYRDKLEKLDQLQSQVNPLLQERQRLINQITQLENNLKIKLENLKKESARLCLETKQTSVKREEYFTVKQKMEELDKKRNYQERVSQKGQDKSDLKNKLLEKQNYCEKQLQELHKKLVLLQSPDVLCPLCEQELDEHYRQKVIKKTQDQHQEIQQQFSLIQEQLTNCERELHNLRQEYSTINQELFGYDSLTQRKGQLEAQLERIDEVYDHLDNINNEITQLEKSLHLESYAQDLKMELKEIETKIQELDYHEQTHGLIRGEEKRWRWVEFEQKKLEDAQRRLEQITQAKPLLLGEIDSLNQQLEQLNYTSDFKVNIDHILQQIQLLNYNIDRHNQVRQMLRQGQEISWRYQELQRAKEEYPLVENTLGQKTEKLETLKLEEVEILKNLENLKIPMSQYQDQRQEIEQLSGQIDHRHQILNNLFGEKGKQEEKLKHLENLRKEYQENEAKLKDINKKYRIYNELSKAFGKNGIQALMIENILPQFEAETNQILTRLTGNQLHVQFLTQKATKSSQGKNKETNFKETLDIMIADANGTRPYETYSGGEAFRINFSIRLALAKLLAQRAGTALQLLIIDEGFGTQDDDGCEKLIAAINGISSDFACILAVTHLLQFKEAFTTRIFINKTDEGSQIQIFQ